MATPTTTFTWAVGTMDRQLSNGAVQTVHYTVTANDGTYSAGAYGSVGLDQPEDDADLTEADIVAAVQAKLGGAEKVTEIQDALAARIVEQITPTQASGKPSSW